MTEQENQMSVLDIFGQSQETFEEAKKKSSDESGNKTKHFRMSSDGTYAVRILPLAPVFDKDGNILPMDRKGYEYPNKELVLKIDGKDNKGKPKPIYVNICNAKYAFPDLKLDLIDEYVTVACDKYSDDEALCKKLKSSSFDGGLKWDSKRCMYIIDADKRGDGIQTLGLSYSQYKDVEDRKLALWEKLLKSGKVPCPISSINDAYLLEITRKTEKKKTEYSFNIDMASGKDELSEKELHSLLDSPRLPEVLYRYTRFHLEATIAFLKQYDEKLQIDVMGDQQIQDCIDKIKMSLPADDNSHFNINSENSGDNASSNASNGIDALWDTFDRLVKEGLDDKSDEGQNLRADIKEFIEEKGLNVRVARGKSNEDLLVEIEDVLSEENGEHDGDSSAKQENEGQNGASEPEPEPEPEEAPARTPRSRANDDTNEPAARTDRRSVRPERRRR